MRPEAPSSVGGLLERNISTECPHCGDTVSLLPQHEPITDVGKDNAYFVALCPNHRRHYCKPILAVYQALNDFIIERYPIPGFEASHIHEAIPKRIREDYAEARRCMFVEAYKGAVALFRRVVEATACDKLGKKARHKNGTTKKLYELIDLLGSESLITKDVKDAAHEVRLFGNYGVHVQDDGLDEVKRDEARDVREICWQLLHTIYIAPFKTRELRGKRVKKGKRP